MVIISNIKHIIIRLKHGQQKHGTFVGGMYMYGFLRFHDYFSYFIVFCSPNEAPISSRFAPESKA